MLSNCGAEEDSWESLDYKEIKLVIPKWNQLWIFIGRTDAECPVLLSPDVKNHLIRKDPDVGKDWGQKEKGMTEDEIVGWHHRLNGHEFEQTPGDSEGQGSLACCSPWGPRVQHDWATELNRTDVPSISQGVVILKIHLMFSWNSDVSMHPAFLFAKPDHTYLEVFWGWWSHDSYVVADFTSTMIL